jgi:hypothetical protein
VLRNIHRYLLSIFTLGVIVQFFLAGLGVFRVQGGASDSRFDHVFAPHRALGNTLFVVSVVVLLAALVARLSRVRWESPPPSSCSSFSSPSSRTTAHRGSARFIQ